MKKPWVILLVMAGFLFFGAFFYGMAKFQQMVAGKARRVMASANMIGMSLSIKMFQTEYDRMPVEISPGSESIPLRTQGALVNILMGKDTKANPKGIQFLQPLPAQNKSGGYYEDDHGQPVIADPWGEPYYVLLTAEKQKAKDKTVPNPDPRENKDHPVIESSVILFSAGPDHDPNTWEDNVLSWK